MKNKFWFFIFLMLISQYVFSQSGTIGDIDIIQNFNSGVKFFIHDTSVNGMKDRKVHFGIWISQAGKWIDDSWQNTIPEEVKYGPEYWKEGFVFHFTYEYLKKAGTSDDTFWATFFIQNTETNETIERKDVEFSIQNPSGQSRNPDKNYSGDINKTLKQTRLIKHEEIEEVMDIFFDKTVADDQSFFVDFPNFKEVYFLSVLNADNNAEFYFIKDGKIIYAFPMYYGNDWKENQFCKSNFL